MKKTLLLSLSLLILAPLAYGMDSQKNKIKISGSRLLLTGGLFTGSITSIWAAYNWKLHQEALQEKKRKEEEKKAIQDQREIANCRSMNRIPCSVINGPYKHFIGKITCIEGDTNQVWGIYDVWNSLRSYEFKAISNYLHLNPPKRGKVYYGKINSLGYCFHESWIKEVTQNKSQEQIYSKI